MDRAAKAALQQGFGAADLDRWTSTNTKLTKRTGWAPKGERYRTHAPFGKWQTQTFIAGLRCHGLVAPRIVNAPMNAAIFERVETQLVQQHLGS
ncbi:transposase [Mesorhizobium sp. M5C.F.Ca.IN.020.29.1.1]|uniref:transposase n=1 Tax=Mesorhizobium sp. M5C.F.Ca.IN.020.29.1.1 TaxID=2496770 RepID=UPI001FE178DB|nr:transposase [Mesorhizobium sp. M5C.F.Ca.IN.020.29.1.1]